MRSTLCIPQGYAMLLAGVATVFMTGSGRQEPAKHTVLRMKDGEMLKRDNFKS
jgi:hypothetical protein